MRAAVIASAILASLLLPAAATAASGGLTLRYDDGAAAPALQAWVDASHVPVAAGQVIIHRARCFDGQGRSCTRNPGDEIWLYAPPTELRYDLSHELGHRFDYRVMTDRARDAFRALVGDPRPWRTSPNSPHEKFAEAYGLCLRRRSISAFGPAMISYRYEATPRTHRRACRIIRQAAVGVFG